MRKKLFFCCILLVVQGLLAAADVNFISPFKGGGGVNLLSRGFDGGANGYGGTDSGPNYDEGVYSDDEMIALGGILNGKQGKSDVSYDDLRNYPITVTVNCPGGFFFTSQSNSAYKVPFEIDIVERYFDAYGGTGTGETYRISPNTTNTAEIIYPDIAGGVTSPGIWFDMVLVLPADNYNNDTTNGNNVLEYDNKVYNIAPNDDYSALVTISMVWACPRKEVNQSIVIPFSGYVPESSSSASSLPTTSSLYLAPTGYSTNLDIATDYGRWIDVANFNFKMFNDTSRPSYDCRFFLSANANPQVSDLQGFLLINENASSHIDPGMDESLAYKARIYRTSDAVVSGEFNGKEFVSVSPSKEEFDALGAASSQVVSYSVQEKDDMYSSVMDGTIQIMLDTPLALMKEGRYEDELYLHIYSYR